jgi:predicted nucleic-acid-binding protein
MLGDANALVAALVPGRDMQRRVGQDMARTNGPLEIGEAVLAEVCWVLERTYRVQRRMVAVLVRDALGSRDFRAWDPELADRALDRMHDSPRFAFVDCLLLERAIAGEPVLTFDLDLARAIERS